MTGMASLKHLARMEYGDALAQEIREEGGVPVFGSNGVTGTHTSANTLAPAIIVGRKGSFGKVTWTDAPGFCIDTAYYIDKRHTGCHLRWLFWALQTLGLDVHSEDTGVPGLSREKAYQAKLPVPSFVEQQRIANFLDEQTARIDALIAEKERLLQCLDELRDATCRSAFTRGLVSKTPLVESGEQFLGEIPVHWKVLPWKRLGYFTGGAGFPIEYQGVTTEELPFFKVKDLDAADLLHPLTETDNTVSRETATKLRANVFPVGTLTFAKVGAALLLMRVRRLGVPGCLDNNMMAFIPDQAVVDPLFAQLALGLLPLDWLVNPGAVPSVSASQVGEVKVALPALNEQRQIAAYVQSKFAEFAGVRSHLHEHIGRLREYRSSLISAAVTGQIDLSTFKAAA